MNIHSSKHQDDVEKNARSSYFNLPALDVSVAFPQATPATKFPPCASDYYQSDDLLTSEEQAVRMKVRECMEKEIAPIMVEYWEKAEFPFHVMPKLGALRVAGGTIKKLPELMLVVLLLYWCIPLGNAHYCTVRIRGAEAEIFTFFGSVKHHCLLGQVLLDGNDIKSLKLRWLRQQIGLASQELALFATTIKENILLGRLDVNQTEIEETARVANARSFIIKLAMGEYNT